MMSTGGSVVQARQIGAPNVLVRSWRFARAVAGNLTYLARTSAPASVYVSYFRTRAAKGSLRRYAEDRRRFQEKLGGLRVSNDWFSSDIPHWLTVFDQHELRDRDIKVLEIGSWEGLSSYFLLQTLPRAQLTCVDTWAGNDEHAGSAVLGRIEGNFDANLTPFRDRLTKFKGTSFAFFSTLSPSVEFDLVYVDGSHYVDDVLLDAIKGFEHLKVGGVMIFDDYFWRYYERHLDNPGAAVNSFLNVKMGAYRVVRVYNDQIVIKKIRGGR
jgi:predicted O-methyltransferase YrrM